MSFSHKGIDMPTPPKKKIGRDRVKIVNGQRPIATGILVARGSRLAKNRAASRAGIVKVPQAGVGAGPIGEASNVPGQSEGVQLPLHRCVAIVHGDCKPPLALGEVGGAAAG